MKFRRFSFFRKLNQANQKNWGIKIMTGKLRATLAVWAILSSTLAFANVSTNERIGHQRPDLEARRNSLGSDVIAPLGADLFGDQVDKYTGKLAFTVTDINIPGNNSLPVAITRTRTIEEWDGFANAVDLRDWSIQVPVIEGVFSEDGWIGDGQDPNARCSQGSGAPPPFDAPEGHGHRFNPNDFWNGYQLKIPGQASQTVLLANAQTPNKNPPSRWTTKDNWLIDCLPTLQNGGVGEGFVATAPDGTKYYFDLMIVKASPFFLTGTKILVNTIYNVPAPGAGVCSASYPASYTCNYYFPNNNLSGLHSPLVDGVGAGNDCPALLPGGGNLFSVTLNYPGYEGSLACASNGSVTQYIYAKLNRFSVHLVATKVEDRYGNKVNYNYDASTQRLNSITASDGRQINISYPSISNAPIIITANGKTWSYGFSDIGMLQSVTLPDNQQWQYQDAYEGLAKLRNQNFWDLRDSEVPYDPCVWNAFSNLNTVRDDQSYSVIVKHPSGAKGTFVFRSRIQGKSYASTCEAMAIWHFALMQKTLSGSAVTPQTWTFDYGLQSSSLSNYVQLDPNAPVIPNCTTTTCVDTSTTQITSPDGSVEKLTFSTNLMASDGKLLESIISKDAVQLTKSNYEYVPISSLDSGFAVKYGTNPHALHDNKLTEYILPQKRVVTVNDGVTYTNQINTFDAFARPSSVTRSNSNGFSKTETVTYSDNLNKWVLGQVATVTDAATLQVEQSNSYDPVTANLLSKSAFGVLQESYTYNADGTMATVKDGKNNSYTLTNWKRGIPQTITAPNATTQSGVVNDSGWLTSITNQLGYTTGYGYDAMGRLISVTPPTGDSVTWAGTTLSFTRLPSSIYGVQSGGWKHAISRGNYRKETYMDALYRPLVVREYDNANVAGTERFTRKSFDTLNREIFSAYPGINAGVAQGVHTEYDALGRVTATKADSELGVLTTTTEYLAGGGIKVTGPDGNVTTRSFRSLDAPSYEQMLTEVAPGGVTTSISRDGFGKPLTITRSGTDGLSISKYFAYDSNQRLCMRTEPETGTSIIDYDAAGNVIWAANGQAVANAQTCDRAAAVAGAKINYTYDALNRITSTDVPGSTNDPTVTYFADGSINSLINGAAKWEYTYNKLGKPVTEKLTLGTRINTITHAYDTLANQTSLTYPSGTSVSYAPNALGQATQAGTYATGLTYRASGFMSAMTYGNGATYSAKPNLRGLPARRLDMKGTTVITDELMGYDEDANPVCVRDSTAGNPGSRDFTYDARDRLIKASAPNQPWVSAEYQYDSQDDIAMTRLGTRQYNYGYNSKNQLSQIGTPATAPSATNFGLMSCTDYSLLADLEGVVVNPPDPDPETGGTGGTGTGGTGTGVTLSIGPSVLPNGEFEVTYSQYLSASGGTGPYTYAVTSGTLPLGLNLTGNRVFGFPQEIGISLLSITATDSLGNTGTQSYEFGIDGAGAGGGGNEVFRVIVDDDKTNNGKHKGQFKQEGEAKAALAAGDTLKYDFIHDAEGRMTAKGTQAYVYDALNRMTQVTGKETYLYDGHGRRVQITKTTDGKQNFPIYSLDGKLLQEDNRQLSKRTEYIYAGGRLVAKNIQNLSNNGSNSGSPTTTTIHTDFLGSPVAETNSAGTVTRVERYTPYGEPSDLQLDAGPGFTGHATDVATGLTYMQQRYYDADIGRFISPDPVGPEEDFIKHFNRYNYALNNPIRYTDPDGRAADPLTLFADILPASGRSFGALGAVVVGEITDNQALVDAGMEGLNEISQSNKDALGALVKLPGQKFFSKINIFSKGVLKASETIGRPVEAVIGGRKRLLRVDIEPNGKLQIQSGSGKDSIIDFRPDLSQPLAPQIHKAFKRLPQSVREQLIKNAEKGLKKIKETGGI